MHRKENTATLHGDEVRMFAAYAMDGSLGDDPVEEYGDRLAALDTCTEHEGRYGKQRQFALDDDIFITAYAYHQGLDMYNIVLMSSPQDTDYNIPDECFDNLRPRITGYYQHGNFSSRMAAPERDWQPTEL